MSRSDSPAAAAAPIAADTRSNPPGSSATGCDSTVGAYPSARSRVSGERRSWYASAASTAIEDGAA